MLDIGLLPEKVQRLVDKLPDYTSGWSKLLLYIRFIAKLVLNAKFDQDFG